MCVSNAIQIALAPPPYRPVCTASGWLDIGQCGARIKA